LLDWGRALKGQQASAVLVDERNARIVGQVNSKTPRARTLRHEADISKGRLITVAIFTAASLLA
jgi:hypothetical protein